jgi:hypothetical protein
VADDLAREQEASILLRRRRSRCPIRDAVNAVFDGCVR